MRENETLTAQPPATRGRIGLQDQLRWTDNLCAGCLALDLFNPRSNIRRHRNDWQKHKGEICVETDIVSLAELKLSEHSPCPLCQLFYGARIGPHDLEDDVYIVLGVSFLYGSFSLDAYSAQPDMVQTFLGELDQFALIIVPQQLFKHDHQRVTMQRVQEYVNAYSTDGGDPMPLIMLAEDGPRRTPVFGHQTLEQHERGITHYLPRIFMHDEIDYRLLESWIQRCRQQHSRCDTSSNFPQSSFRLPQSIKLIHCVSQCIVEEISPPPYATLSYVWGRREYIDAEIWVSQVGKALPDDIPAVVRDALEVTTNIGLKYLWVDQYCIDQSDHFDRVSQISMMDKIYALSDITIVAAAGQNAKYGLPGVGERHRSRASQYLRHNNFTAVVLPARPERLIRNSTWATRGWTLQEGVLCRRRLVFTDEQVYFECNTSYETEALARPVHFYDRSNDSFHGVEIREVVRPGYFGQLAGGIRTYNSARRELWVDTYLTDFMARDLSFASDRVNAFRGIFRYCQLSDISGIPFVSAAGLVHNLAWTHRHAWSATRSRFHPSFSWAGWTGAPKLDFGLHGLEPGKNGESRNEYIDFLNFDPSRWNENLSDIDSLRVKGYTTKIQVRGITTVHSHARLSRRSGSDSPFVLNRIAASSTKMETLQILEPDENDEVYDRIHECLLLEESERSIRALVIARRAGYVERIGVLELFADFYRDHDKLPGNCVEEMLELR